MVTKSEFLDVTVKNITNAGWVSPMSIISSCIQINIVEEYT
jgi:hypothetical protein